MSENICRNCKWASWEMTRHTPPRPNPNRPGKCRYPLSRVALPISLGGPHWRLPETPPMAIWIKYEDQCRVWERAEAK